MKSTAVMFPLLLSVTLAISVTSYSISDTRVESLPSIFKGRLNKRAVTPDNNGLGLGTTLGGLLGAVGQNGTSGGQTSLSDAIRALQNTLFNVTPNDVRNVLTDSSPLAVILDNIPLVGPVLNLLRNLLSVTGNLIDRVASLVVNVLRCVAGALPQLLQ